MNSMSSCKNHKCFNITKLSSEDNLCALFYRFSLLVSEGMDSEAILLLMMSTLRLAIAARVKWQFILKNYNAIASLAC